MQTRLDIICLHEYLIHCHGGCSKHTLSPSIMLLESNTSALAQRWVYLGASVHMCNISALVCHLQHFLEFLCYVKCPSLWVWGLSKPSRMLTAYRSSLTSELKVVLTGQEGSGTAPEVERPSGNQKVIGAPICPADVDSAITNGETTPTVYNS